MFYCETFYMYLCVCVCCVCCVCVCLCVCVCVYKVKCCIGRPVMHKPPHMGDRVLGRPEPEPVSLMF